MNLDRVKPTLVMLAVILYYVLMIFGMIWAVFVDGDKKLF